jgi:hypothetical protein
MKNDQLNPKELCIKGEDLAGKFLKKSGYKILKRNYVSKYGEIALSGATLSLMFYPI